MKKKFLLGVAAGLFAVASVMSYTLSNDNGDGNISLDEIAVMAQAQNGEVIIGPICACVTSDICGVYYEGTATITQWGVRVA